MAPDREVKAMQSTLATLRTLKHDEQQRVLDWLASKLGLEAAPGHGAGAGVDGPAASAVGGKGGSIKEFLKLKSPNDHVGRVAALAYFLTHTGGKATYKTADLSAARVDAALPKFNTSDAVWHAQQAGYLTTGAKRGTYQVTATGESLVEAMPNAAAVKSVKSAGKKRRRKSNATKRTTRKRVAAKKK